MKQFSEIQIILKIDKEEWNQAVALSQNPFDGIEELNAATQTLILSLQAHWNIVLSWVLIKRKWIKRHQIAGRKADIKAYEPLGERYFRLLELCIQVYAKERPIEYDNAYHWYALIIRTLKKEAFQFTIAVAQGQQKQPTKTQALEEMIKEARALSASPPRNPYTESENPHLHKLIALAIKNRGYWEDYWEAFTRSYRQWVKDFRDSAWNVRYIRQENIYRTSGRGANKGITLPALSSEDLGKYI